MLSMTGFGKAEVLFNEGFVLTAEISSVNRKQLEIRSSLPQECSSFEDTLRKIAGNYITRGALQVRVALQSARGAKAGTAAVEQEQLEALVRACMAVRKNCGLDEQAVQVEQLLSLPGMIRYTDIDPESPELKEAFQQVLEAAFGKFRTMRAAEGENLKQDLYARLDHLKALLEKIEPETARIPAMTKQRILAKLEAEALPVPGNEEQLLREILFYTDRADVAEEITRLKSHFEQMGRYLEADTPSGRSLDFLAQEMFREINTLGNKAGIPAVSALVVEFKSELEKMREQIQNVE